jgi:mRNA degradation ribonuclease J1/J2
MSNPSAIEGLFFDRFANDEIYILETGVQWEPS